MCVVKCFTARERLPSGKVQLWISMTFLTREAGQSLAHTLLLQKKEVVPEHLLERKLHVTLHSVQ